MTNGVTIYHNPSCATSRNTLAMIRATGVEPIVVEYLKHPPTRDRLVQLIAFGGARAAPGLKHDHGIAHPAIQIEADPAGCELEPANEV